MHPVLRIALYVVLVAVAVIFGYRFLQAYSQRVDQAAHRYGTEETAAPVAPEGTNQIDTDITNALTSAVTNLPADAPTDEVSAGSTNLIPPETAPIVAIPSGAPSSPPDRPAASASPSFGLDAALTLACVLGLALLVASDVSHYVANRAHLELYNDEGEGASSPEYDQAEQAWANGDHLEALRLLRDHLKRHPRQLHVAFRIAEIYEKDLGNHLAAALEYEEILKHKLPPDRWGWSAIHLCNLYNRLNQPERAEALLRRIVGEYGETPAAKKARERLGIPEESAIETSAESEPEPADGPKLPPGFRPKKK